MPQVIYSPRAFADVQAQMQRMRGQPESVRREVSATVTRVLAAAAVNPKGARDVGGGYYHAIGRPAGRAVVFRFRLEGDVLRIVRVFHGLAKG